MRKLSLLTSLTLALALSACGGEATVDPAGASGDALPKVTAPAGKTWAEVVSKTEAGGYVMGNPEAPIKLVEFASLTCGACAQFANEAFATIRDDYVASGRVSFELRNYVRDPIDLTAAMLTRCGPETSYFALSEQVLANQPQMMQTAQTLGEAQYAALQQMPESQRYVELAKSLGLTEFFAQRGVSLDQSAACLAKADAASALAEQTNGYTKEFDVQGTPTFLLNGQKVEYAGWADLQTKIQQLGAR